MSTQKYLSKIIRFLKKATLKFERVYFFKIDLKTFFFELEDEKITVQLVNNIEDLDDIIAERGESYVIRYEKWFNRKFQCFRATIENKTIGILWLNNTNVVEVLFGYKEKIENSKTEAWVVDGYVLEKYRKLGAYKLIWHTVLFEAKKSEIEYVFAAIQDSNIRSFKVHFKLGMNSNVYKVLYYFKILWFNLYLFKHFASYKNIALLKKNINFS
ncbi:MAG TPA: hypothetical protein DIW31_06675 [Bacteroidales bacterium]|nr:hypothetical protein [Bacteroidales bacterium]